MQYAPTRTIKALSNFPVHLAICMTICGAYAVAPYTGILKNGDPFIPRIKMNIKPDGFSIPRTKRNLILIRFSNPRPKMNLNLAGFFNPGPKGIAIPGA